MGLFISIGLVILGVSSYYRLKNKNIEHIFSVLSLLSLIISLTIGLFALNDIGENIEKNVNKYRLILKTINALNITIMMYILYNII